MTFLGFAASTASVFMGKEAAQRAAQKAIISESESAQKDRLLQQMADSMSQAYKELEATQLELRMIKDKQAPFHAIADDGGGVYFFPEPQSSFTSSFRDRK